MRHFDTHARNRARLDEERATIFPLRPTSLAHMRIRGRRNAYAGPSTLQVLNHGTPSAHEQEIMNRLQVGEGVSGIHLADLLEKCALCDHYFVLSLKPAHSRGCVPNV